MKNRSLKIFIFLCIVPVFVFYAVFAVYPVFRSLVMAFYSWSGLSEAPRFIGVDNFKTMLADEKVWHSLKNNIFLLIVVPVITMLFSMFFAVMLSGRNMKGKNFFRTVFFFPNVLSVVAVSVLWLFVYNSSFGILNSFLTMVGLDGLTRIWLGDVNTVMGAVSAPMIWMNIGFYMVMYIAAIENIPSELYEAARIDGATKIKQFSHITLPLIWDIVRITIVFYILNVFKDSFANINVMTAGGPDSASEVLASYMYRQAFTQGNFGYAAAIGIMLVLITIVFVAVSTKITKRDDVQY